jgi:hypothetical protein
MPARRINYHNRSGPGHTAARRTSRIFVFVEDLATCVLNSELIFLPNRKLPPAPRTHSPDTGSEYNVCNNSTSQKKEKVKSIEEKKKRIAVRKNLLKYIGSLCVVFGRLKLLRRLRRRRRERRDRAVSIDIRDDRLEPPGPASPHGATAACSVRGFYGIHVTPALHRLRGIHIL